MNKNIKNYIKENLDFELYAKNLVETFYYNIGGNMERVILHSDMNSFYASVEMMLNPSLRGKAVAVCGATEDRHGIVLAKSDKAKKAGVKTGMVNWEAKQLCKDLILVPPQYEQYLKYSKLAHQIYYRYTDLVEPFGMDECWLDVTGHHKSGTDIAEEIRQATREELGLTVSIGVSFNKIFAKLGSDMKKPDATTIISRENFKEKVWSLPASELLFVGRRTTKTLEKYGIRTIGDIALSNGSFMKKILGKNGFDLWLYANGMDTSPVSHIDSKPVMKSVSRGITCVESLLSVYEAQRVIAELCISVSKGLRREHLLATGVQVAIKEDNLTVKQYSAPLEFPTFSAKELFDGAVSLFFEKHKWKRNIRSISVRTYNLVYEKNFQQLSLGYDIDAHEKQEIVDTALTEIREKQGRDTVFNCCRLLGTKMPTGKSNYSSLPPASISY